MESAFPAVLESGRIRVLLVPVHPITQDSFRKYVDLLTQYSVVYLGDLTPPRNHGSTVGKRGMGGIREGDERSQ